jgi:hypothetical protein
VCVRMCMCVCLLPCRLQPSSMNRKYHSVHLNRTPDNNGSLEMHNIANERPQAGSCNKFVDIDDDAARSSDCAYYAVHDSLMTDNDSNWIKYADCSRM